MPIPQENLGYFLFGSPLLAGGWVEERRPEGASRRVVQHIIKALLRNASVQTKRIRT